MVGVRLGTLALVLLALWGLWEGYRRLWSETGWTRPFVVDSTTMPHLHDIVRALFETPDVIAALLGIAFFLVVVLPEKLSSTGRRATRMSAPDAVVSARSVTKTFGKGGVTALQDVDLEVGRG